MKTPKAKLLTCVLATALACPAQAAVCPPFAETLTILAQGGMKAALELALDKLFNSFTDQLFSFASLKVAAQKVLTSQVATSAKAQINAAVALAGGEMAAIGSLETAKQSLRVYQDFSAISGQGVDPCGQLAAQAAAVVTSGEAGGIAAGSIAEVAAAPGRYGNPEGYVDRMLRQRQSLFGSEDEAKLGYGPATKAEVVTTTGEKFAIAGADVNSRVLFADTKDPLVLRARDAYLNYMAGVPDTPITQDVASLPAGKEYLALKRRKDAVMSIGLNSLSLVAAENTPNTEAGGKSKMQAMRDMVGQYYGDKAKDVWKGWMSQSERGLMVDQVKMGAAQLAIESELLAQSKRLESQLSALLSMEAQHDGGTPDVQALGNRPAVR